MMDLPSHVFLDGRVIATTGDITRQDTDAIVNAANSTLLGGGGVDGAIHAAGGPRILEECREIREKTLARGLPPGQAVITTGGLLRARFVIHTVGPIYGRHDGNERKVLGSCYNNSLALAVANDLVSVAFPSISTGAFGYPRDEGAQVSSEAIQAFLTNDSSIKEVRLVFFSARDLNMFLRNHTFGRMKAQGGS
jgi:O-acetyl-ADP-ribose deacetylase (regulator of RNase III)